MRLHQVSYSLKAHKETGRAVSASRLAEVAGFAPTTFHALGSRLAASHPARSFHLLITNVPGPQFPLYAAGAQMLASYPVLPLLPGHAVAVGVDLVRRAGLLRARRRPRRVPDLDVLGHCIREALDELVDASSSSRSRAPRGRLSGRGDR